MGLRKKSDVLRCSFCGKSQKDVKKLIAGPSVYICNECVEICDEILADDADYTEQAQGQAPASGRPHVVLAPRARCSLCRTFVLTAEALFVPSRGHLCPACEDVVRAAVDRSDALRTGDSPQPTSKT